MATTPETPQNEKTAPAPGDRSWLHENAGRRRLAYGANVALSIFVVLVILVLLNVLAYRYFETVDLTATGRYTLAPQTRKLISDLDKQFKIVTVLRGEDPYRQQARELIDVYGRLSGGQIEVEHFNPDYGVARLGAFYGDLRDRYEGDLEQVQDAIDTAEARLQDLARQSEQQLAIVRAMRQSDALADADAPLPADGNGQGEAGAKAEISDLLRRIVAAMGQMQREIERIEEQVDATLDESLPDYQGLIRQMRQTLSTFRQNLFGNGQMLLQELAQQDSTPVGLRGQMQQLADMFEQADGISGEAVTALEEASVPSDYNRVRQQVANSESVIVLGPDAIRVIPQSDLFREAREAQEPQQGPQQRMKWQFLGEELITGALIAMTLEQPPLVIFVGGQQPVIERGGRFSEVAERLRNMNFDVQEWSPVMRPGPMGQQPQPPGPPPEPEAGQPVVWVIPPSSPAGMQDPRAMMAQQQRNQAMQQVVQRIRNGEAALVMLGLNPGAAFGATDPMAEALTEYGIEHQADRLILREMATANRRKQVVPYFEYEQWSEDLPMSKAVSGMTGMFQMATPLSLNPETAANVELTTLAELSGPDVWAADDFQDFPDIERPEDLEPQDYPVAVAAEVEGENPSKLVVIADGGFASNQVVNFGALGPGTAQVFGARFPANAELFMNSVYWLADLEPLIAASPRVQDVPRVAVLSPTAEAATKTLLLVGLPLVALIAGFAVWLTRRDG